MPEGPETHFIADRLTQTLVGKRLVEVFFAAAELKPQEQRLQGARVQSATARGKAMLVRFDNGLTLYTHSQLLGYWEFQQGVVPVMKSNPRVFLATKDSAAALYIAPKVEVWRSDEIETHAFLAKLGPDILDPAVDPEIFRERLHQPPFVRRKLAVLLLQQEFAAGMGNYLRSEVLFEAALAPMRIAGSLSPVETSRLADALLAIARRAYRAKFKGALPQSSKEYLVQTAKTFRFKVFEREGYPCPRCKGTIIMERLASRRLYYCRDCQH